MARGRTRIVLAAALATAAASLTGCLSNGLGEVTCISDPPPAIAFDGPVRDAATAGMIYRQGLSASASSLLGPTHGIEVIEVPGGATLDARGATWVPPPALAGTTQRFRVRSDRDFCGRTAELSWSVLVHPPIQITRFEAIPAVVSTRGSAVQLQAEYSGGEGRLAAPFAATIANGISFDAGVVGATTEFRLAVVGPAGDVLERSVTVLAESPPVIAGASFFPPVATAGDTITLSWGLDGTVRSLTLDPGGITLQPFSGFFDVAGAPGVTYTLTARNDAGDVATATLSPVVLPRPVVSSLTASPPHPAYLETTSVTAVFEGGTGVLHAPGAPEGVPIASGVPVVVGPLHGNAQLFVDVSNGASTVRELLLIDLGGPGTWERVAGGAGENLIGHTATLLRGGSVLLAGGHSGSGAPGGTMIWDPVTGATMPGPPLLHSRSGHAAAVLRDGRVLLAGGTTGNGAPVDEAELLDVEAGTSVPAGPVGDAWWFPQLVALADGSAVLHSASMYSGHEPILRFDPGSSTLSQLTVAAGLGWVRPFALADGRVLLLSGGQYALTPSAILDPATGDLSATGATLRQMSGFEAVALADGRILVLDGQSPAEVFDPVAGTFAWTGAPTTTGRTGRAALLDGGEVLVSGLTSMRYDPATGAFRETGGMFEDGQQPLVLLPDGSVIATGGWPQRYHP